MDMTGQTSELINKRDKTEKIGHKELRKNNI